ncbi:hypothetical protein MIND_00214000 [Mycena indigotica]|uniref:DUF1479-domain-containing protein n=1 Tax=Mycena indigotica TaxID=2126181 RepID=A0A8H6T6V5_9AGAR|nr:uncharacterized protein MIND_00214000 [Mycena indigotica]KAF7312021.1 hypothetical protein MIND_00214000 [Mycena indigotica]
MSTDEATFADIKAAIAAENGPDFEQKATQAWAEIIAELQLVTNTIAQEGPSYIPTVSFADIQAGSLSAAQIAEVKRKGSVVIKDVIDDKQARLWKEELEEFVKKNPQAEGFPEDDKQFFHLYWTRSQLEARAHPNMLAATTWLNTLYQPTGTSNASTLAGVDLKTPLSYADRFRIRRPGFEWNAHPPHIDGGTIERWQDIKMRSCFSDILAGSWKKHDPYVLEPRLEARTSLYQRPNQSSVFRTFQGWLALSATAPGHGTLKVFPDVLLSNAYIILRPFFRPLVAPDSKEIWDVKNWVFDLTTPEIAGVFKRQTQVGFNLHPTEELHPHLSLNKTMTSVPAVNPGDTVFWHCDVVHSVEREHNGNEDSAVMYIPSVPLTPANKRYIARQADAFRAGIPPPDFPVATTGVNFVGLGSEDDLALGKANEAARVAMGLQLVAASA